VFSDNFDSKAATVALELLRDIPEKTKNSPYHLKMQSRGIPPEPPKKKAGKERSRNCGTD